MSRRAFSAASRIAWTDAAGAHAVGLAPSEQVKPVVYVPAVRGLTAQARKALPAEVPRADAVFNTARAALLVYALTMAPDLLLTATDDRLHQPYRAPSMPKRRPWSLRLRGAGIPAFVSGAGPSVLALTGGTVRQPRPTPNRVVVQVTVVLVGGCAYLVMQTRRRRPCCRGRVG
jgi:homoserine kinase